MYTVFQPARDPCHPRDTLDVHFREVPMNAQPHPPAKRSFQKSLQTLSLRPDPAPLQRDCSLRKCVARSRLESELDGERWSHAKGRLSPEGVYPVLLKRDCSRTEFARLPDSQSLRPLPFHWNAYPGSYVYCDRSEQSNIHEGA